MENCVFCKIVKGEIEAEKVFEDEGFLVIKDVNPKVDGHLLVVSKRHFDNFLDLSSEIGEKLFEFVRKIVEKLGVKDFNLVVNNGKFAGQLVGHFHLHILPRREGDGFRLNV